MKTDMKKIITLILISILTLSCSSDDRVGDVKLTGKWNWVKTTGGIDGYTETPESTDRTMKLEISENSIRKYLNGDLQFESNYSVEFEDNHGEQVQIITYENQGINLQILSLTENTLKIKEYQIADGFDYKYVRN